LDCNQFCIDEGISIGGYYTGNENDCEAQNNLYVEYGCCCYKLII